MCETQMLSCLVAPLSYLAWCGFVVVLGNLGRRLHPCYTAGRPLSSSVVQVDSVTLCTTF